MVTFLFVNGLLLGLAAFCAVGWAVARRRLTTARRNEEQREQGHRVVEDRVRLAEHAARFGTWDWDPTTDLFALSAGAASLSELGQGPREVSGRELDATVHPDDRAAAKAARERAFVAGCAYQHEFRRVSADGSVRWYRNHGHVELAGNVPRRVAGAIMDITGEKAVVRRLNESAERMRLAESAASFGIWEMDLATRHLESFLAALRF